MVKQIDIQADTHLTEKNVQIESQVDVLIKTLREHKQDNAQNILYSENVLQTLHSLEIAIRVIDSEPNPSQKRIAFFTNENTKPLRDEFLLQETTPEMDAEAELLIQSINNKLVTNPEVLANILKDLFEAQKLNLKIRGISENKRSIELEHIVDVVKLCANNFPEIVLLQLIAMVHDSYKFLSDTNMQLGLHELASTTFGSELFFTVLQKYQQPLQLEDAEIIIATNLCKRAIYSHGKGEYPDKNSQDIDDSSVQTNVSVDENVWTRVKSLFGKQLYIATGKPACINNSDQKTETMSTSIAALNAMDAVTGSHYKSLIKYNLSYPNTVVCGLTLYEYFDTRLFNSFASNLETDSLTGLAQNPKYHDTLNTLIKNYSVVRARILKIIKKPSDEDTEITQSLEQLVTCHKNLKEINTANDPTSESATLKSSRDTFDETLRDFVFLVGRKYFSH